MAIKCFTLQLIFDGRFAGEFEENKKEKKNKRFRNGNVVDFWNDSYEYGSALHDIERKRKKNWRTNSCSSLWAEVIDTKPVAKERDEG